jgi:hypothetical protein
MSAHTLHTALNRSVPVPEERSDNPYLTTEALHAVNNRYLRLALAGRGSRDAALGASSWKLAVAMQDIRL